MKPLVGLEMDEKGSLMVTYECARCREVQKRAFRSARVMDEVKCVCGATAILTHDAMKALDDTVVELRSLLANLNANHRFRIG
jgi:hypothetical protein